MRSHTRPNRLLVPASIDLGAPRAVHCRKDRHHAYIGRPAKWGNPYVVGRHGTREQSIALYEQWLRKQDELIDSLDELRGMVLGCWCAPRACHGDLLVRLANANAKQRRDWRAER